MPYTRHISNQVIDESPNVTECHQLSLAPHLRYSARRLPLDSSNSSVKNLKSGHVIVDGREPADVEQLRQISLPLPLSTF